MSADDKKIRKIALLVAAAVIMQVAESLFPQIVPGVKPGFANMIVIIALVNMGFKAALEISVIRTIISSFLLGTFLSPSFILSFTSAITSTLVMGGLYRLLSNGKNAYLSVIGISIIGALVHNLTQLVVVYILLIRNSGVFLLLPWLGAGSVIMGWIIGAIALRVCVDIEKRSKIERFGAVRIVRIGTGNGASFVTGKYVKKDSFVHNMPAATKIFLVAAMSVVVMIINNFYGYAAVLVLLVFFMLLSKIPFISFFAGIRRAIFFLAAAFVVPFFFTDGGRILFELGAIRVTDTGFRSGVLIASRIILLMAGTAVLMMTTTPWQLAEGIRRILQPFWFVGISADRVSKIVSVSLAALPEFWMRTCVYIKKMKLNGRSPGEVAVVLSGLITMLYLRSEEKGIPR